VTLASGIQDPGRIVLDGQNVYWITMNNQGTVERVSKYGGWVQTIGWTGSEPRSLATDGMYVYFSSSAGLWRVGAWGGQQPVQLAPVAYDVETDGTYVYYVGNDGIYAVPAMGGQIPYRLTESGLTSSQAELALDGNSLVWSDRHSDGNRIAIARMPKAGGNVGMVSSEGWDGKPVPIVARGAKLYWMSRGLEDIFEWDLATDVERPVAETGEAPLALAVDGDFVYWTTGQGLILKAPISGGQPIVLAEGQAHPSSIAVDRTHVYWSNRLDGTIRKINK
jgi:hypothetical protein